MKKDKKFGTYEFFDLKTIEELLNLKKELMGELKGEEEKKKQSQFDYLGFGTSDIYEDIISSIRSQLARLQIIISSKRAAVIMNE